MADTMVNDALTRFNTLNKLINLYPWLIESYMLDFFTDNHYQKLPLSWRQKLEALELEDLGELLKLDEELVTTKMWPLALLCIRRLLFTFSLPRLKNSTVFHSRSLKENGMKTECMKNARLKNLFVKNVKPKKRYEISNMAKEAARLAADSNVHWVLDVGSGVGHLCRILSYGYGLAVCGIEAQHQLIDKAKKLDSELEVTASKHLPEDDMKILRLVRPKHVAATITPETAISTITQVLKYCAESTKCPNFGIVGLHPCGDLAVTLLRVFVECPEAKFINIVGCCYHKMYMRPGVKCGFPLSSLCTKEKPQLSANAGALGCHAIETYATRLTVGDYDHLKIHCFRAALERIIVRHNPEDARSGLNNVKHYPELSFPEYCKKALKGLSLSVPQEDFQSPVTYDDLQSWKRVVIYYSLWLLMGPAIESIILLDRLIFLHEHGISGQLIAAFDPLLSPRNQILCAIKEK